MPGGILLLTTSGSSAALRKAVSLRVGSLCGLLAVNITTPRASVTSTRSMSSSSSRRPAIEATAALLCATNAEASSAPVTLTTLLPRASRSPSSFCSTVA